MIDTFVVRKGEKPFKDRLPNFLHELGLLCLKYNIFISSGATTFQGGGWESGYEIGYYLDEHEQPTRTKEEEQFSIGIKPPNNFVSRFFQFLADITSNDKPIGFKQITKITENPEAARICCTKD